MRFVTKLCLVAGGAVALSQICTAQQPSPNFEVASVRAADPKSRGNGLAKGGPGTADPGRITYAGAMMRTLLMGAFGVPLDQIAGPDFVMAQDFRFDITAIVPPGSTKDQVTQMLLNLLKDRFHLTYHTQKKDFDMWALTVAKGGAKLQDAAPAEGPPPEPPKPGTPIQRAQLDRDGFPILPAGRPFSQGVGSNGVQYITFRMATPQMLLNMLQFDLGGRTEDRTGLTGKYDFHLKYSAVGLPGPFGRGGLKAAPPGAAAADPAGDPAPGPDLFNALEKQLGLKLEKTKTSLDVYVIDHLDKSPQEN